MGQYELDVRDAYERVKKRPFFGPPLKGKGQYELRRVLGVGGMGAVFEATDRKLGRKVALKIASAATNDAERFRVEALSTAAFTACPSIVIVYDAGVVSDELFIAMELIQGEDLASLLDNGRTYDEAGGERVQKGPLTEEEWRQHFAQVFLNVFYALEFAHANGVTHRDVKPGNIMVLEGYSRVKLLDFGIAKSQRGGRKDLTVAGALLGTPYYMAPEQVSGRPDVGPPADQWAAASVLHEALTGGIPYIGTCSGDDPLHVTFGKMSVEIKSGYAQYRQKLPNWVPQEIGDMLERMLQPEPEGRFESMREAVEILAQAAGLKCPSSPKTTMDDVEATGWHEVPQLPGSVHETLAEPESPVPPAPEIVLDDEADLPGEASVMLGVIRASPVPVAVQRPTEPPPQEVDLSRSEDTVLLQQMPNIIRPNSTYYVFLALFVLAIALVVVAILLTKPSITSTTHLGMDASPRPSIPTSTDAAIMPVDADVSSPEGLDAAVDTQIVSDGAVEEMFTTTDVPTIQEEDSGSRHHSSRHHRDRDAPPPPETPNQHAARVLREQSVAQCCRGTGGTPLATLLREDEEHPVRGLRDCREPDPPCAEHDDHRPWCRMCGHH